MDIYRHGRAALLTLAAVSLLYSILAVAPVFAQGNLWQQLRQTAKDAVRSTVDAARDVDDAVDTAVDDVTGYRRYNRTDYSQQSNPYSQSNSQPNYSSQSHSDSYTQPNYSQQTSVPAQQAPAYSPNPSAPQKIYSPYSGNQRASYFLSHPQNASGAGIPSSNASGMYPVSVAPGLPTTDHLNPTY